MFQISSKNAQNVPLKVSLEYQFLSETVLNELRRSIFALLDIYVFLALINQQFFSSHFWPTVDKKIAALLPLLLFSGHIFNLEGKSSIQSGAFILVSLANCPGSMPPDSQLETFYFYDQIVANLP